MIDEMWIDSFWCVISLLYMVFSVEFERMLYFQGFEGISGGIVVIFDGVKIGENIDF